MHLVGITHQDWELKKSSAWEKMGRRGCGVTFTSLASDTVNLRCLKEVQMEMLTKQLDM